MSRNGAGVYSLPAGTEAIAGQTIDSSDFNTLTQDLANDNNTARPVAYGGTGATNAADALTNLGAQPVDATTTAFAALTFAANKGLYATGADAFATYDLTVGGRLVAATTFTDPNADRVFGWDDSAGAFVGFALGTGLGFNGTTIEMDIDLQTWAALTPSAFFQTLTDDADAPAARSTLGLGTAAVKNTSTSGNNVPLLDGGNTWSAPQTISRGNATSALDWFILSPTDFGTGKPGFYISKSTTANRWNLALYDGVDNSGQIDISASSFTLGGVAIPTISSTSTLTNKTLSSPTLSGTVGGGATFSGDLTFSGSIIVLNRDAPVFDQRDTGGSTNAKNWRLTFDGDTLGWYAVNDAFSVYNPWVVVGRSGATVGTVALSGTSLTFSGVAVPTISSTDTLSNKTLSSPTLSGTIAGTMTFSGGSITASNVSDDVGFIGSASGTHIFSLTREVNSVKLSSFENIEFWTGATSGAGSGTKRAEVTSAGILVDGKAALSHSGSYTSGKVTFSTSDPSGGSDGDVWYKYTA